MKRKERESAAAMEAVRRVLAGEGIE